MNDEERLADLDNWGRILKGHLTVSPIQPRRRLGDPPREVGPSDDTDIDGDMPTRAHLRDLNLAVSAAIGHLRALYSSRSPRPAPVSRVDPETLPLPPVPAPLVPPRRDPMSTPVPMPADPADAPDEVTETDRAPLRVREVRRMDEAPPWVLAIVIAGIVFAALSLMVPVFVARALLHL
jgi:hypothetical protein